MSDRLPEQLDPWRMVAARRVFEGSVPLADMPRLRSLLADDAGEVRYSMEFGRDIGGVAFVALVIDAGLPLECQRSLQRFVLPVHVEQRIGLIRDETDEDALPPGYEAQLVQGESLAPLDLLEDELILAVPAVPAMSGTEAMDAEWAPAAEEQDAINPFAALKALKRDT